MSVWKGGHYFLTLLHSKRLSSECKSVKDSFRNTYHDPIFTKLTILQFFSENGIPLMKSFMWLEIALVHIPGIIENQMWLCCWQNINLTKTFLLCRKIVSPGAKHSSSGNINLCFPQFWSYQRLLPLNLWDWTFPTKIMKIYIVLKILTKFETEKPFLRLAI